MAVDTLIKRSAALRFGRGPTTRPPQGASTAFTRGSGLGLYYFEVVIPPTFTTRLTLTGPSLQRLTISGPSSEILTLEGASAKRLTMVGSSP